MARRLAVGLAVATAVACLREAPPRIDVELIAAPTPLSPLPTSRSPDTPLPADSTTAGVCICPAPGYSLTDHWTLRSAEGGTEARISAHAELTDNSVVTLSSPSLTKDSICYHPATSGPLRAQMRGVRLVASQPIVAKRIVWSFTAP